MKGSAIYKNLGITKEEFKNLLIFKHYKEIKSLQTIAEELNTSYKCIFSYFSNLEIKKNKYATPRGLTTWEKLNITEKEFEKLLKIKYYQENLSINQISLELGYGRTVIDHWFNKFNIAKKPNYKDLSNQIINNLSISTSFKKENGIIKWLCKCLKCGKEKYIGRPEITKGQQTCGCGQGQTPYVEASFTRLYASYKTGAKRRNLEFNISKEDFRKITKQNCYYCGIQPKQIAKGRSTKIDCGDYIYNGLDRLINDLSYTLDNVVSCCSKCNYMKRIMGEKDFIEHCIKIANCQEIKNGK